MNAILDFLENNYIWFLVAAVVLLFALVGFVVDSKRKQKKMEGNLEGTNTEQNPVNEVPVTPVPDVEPVQSNPEEVVTPTETVTAPFEATPVNPEVLNLNQTTNSNEMVFNDIPAASPVESSAPTEPVKEEIIEPFNIGTPVESPAPAVEPVVSEPAVTPVVEPTNVNVNPTPVVNETAEPVVNIQE